MTRRIGDQNTQNSVESLFEKLDQLNNSPLQAIIAELRQGLDFAHQARIAGGCSQAHFEAVRSQTQFILQLLPLENSVRFAFDAQMIHAVKEHWNGEKQKLSHSILPVTRDEWAHQRTILPVGAYQGSAKTINVIHFPSNGAIESINLLVYPFLHHELAHNLYLFDDSFFKIQFGESLAALITKLRLQAISDHGKAKNLSEQIRHEISAYWQPTDNHQNWAHEIAMDVTALYTCGPAYLATFHDQIENSHINPYHLTQNHPPYAVRVEALIFGCRQLGLERETKILNKVLRQWQTPKYQHKKDNHYIALTNSEIVADCVKAVLATCQFKDLPKCDRQAIEQTRYKLQRGETPEWGTELIIAAWLKYETDQTNYESWQKFVVQDLLDSLIP